MPFIECLENINKLKKYIDVKMQIMHTNCWMDVNIDNW